MGGGPAGRPYLLYQRFECFADRLATGLAVSHLDVAAYDGQYRRAFDFPPMPWRRFVLAVEFVDVDRAFLVHIDNRDVAVGAEADGAFLRVNLPNLSRILGGAFDILVER